VALVRLLTPVVAHGQSKWARALRLRRDGGARLVRWGREERDSRRPTVWFHASSVGETLQAHVVCRRLLELRPDLQVAFTWFSPSASAAAEGFGADVQDAFPWDAAGPIRRVLDSLQPALLVFTQREVWPVAARMARQRGIPVALVAATLPEGAGRLGPLARGVLGDAMSGMDFVGAVAGPDATRFERLGAPDDVVGVTGDPGVDSALERARGVSADLAWLRPFSEDVPTLVAGSTWPADERRLLEALRMVRDSGRGFRVVLAPHEPGEETVLRLVAEFAEAGWSTRTLAQVEESGSEVAMGELVVVERVGVLAGLYRAATVAYIGGGFGSDGLHSVVEPAAEGVPSVFGPRGHSNAATDLLREGGARAVDGADALAGALDDWLGDPDARTSASEAARRYIERQKGAADRTAARLLELFGSD